MDKKNKIVIGLVILILVILIVLFSIVKKNIDDSKTKLYYRVYTEDGWSIWYYNNQVAGEKNKKILAIEAKIESEETGHILYNTFSSNNDFSDNDSYDGEIAGDKKEPIYGIKMFISDNLYKNYKLYYRTYNKKDEWLGWTSNYNVSGDNEVDIEQIQIRLIDNDELFDEDTNNTSIGF